MNNTINIPAHHRALIASTLLHAVLLAALSRTWIGYEPDAAEPPPTLTVAILELEGGFTLDGTESESPDTVPATAPDPSPEPETDAETASDPETIVDSNAGTSPEPAVVIEVDAAVASAGEPMPTAEDEPVPGPQTTPEPVPAEERPETLAVNVEHDAEPPIERVADPVAATEPPRPSQPIAEAESVLLGRRIEQWAQSFASLGDWQPERQWVDRGQAYSAAVARIPPSTETGIESAVVTVTTERDGKRYATEIQMQRLAFSHFAQFIDRWDPQVQIHDDEIDGRFHSNTDIYVSRSGGIQPTFLGKVTTAQNINTSMSDRSVRRKEVFLGGLETRVRRIPLPHRSEIFTADDSVDSARVHHFPNASRIEFYPDGTYAWQTIDKRGRALSAPNRGRLTEAPHYFVADEEASLAVRGVVNGQVLVYSPDDIVIEDDLVYAVDPRVHSASDDYVGLIAARSVAIAEPAVTGDGDLTVHAAIYAGLRFAVRNFRRRDDATLYLHGSLTARSLTATEPRFRTKLSYDARLEDLKPPSFPVTDRYEISDWDGRWTELP